jgi:DNA-binding transcriptional ArsR family regulator
MEPTITVTGANLKALTHPLRVQVLGLLRTYGPATATSLAQRLGLTSGALSYHLRQLERYGFIAEDTERGNERDRWWRAVHRTTEFDAQGLDPAAAEAGDAYEQGIITSLTRSLTQAQADRGGWPTEWRKAFTLSDVLLELTPAEAERLEHDLLALLASYPQLDAERGPRPGAWSVSTRFQIVPLSPADAADPVGTDAGAKRTDPGDEPEDDV